MSDFIESLAVIYRLRFAKIVVYMLQASEYQTDRYLRWFWRANNFNKVMDRHHLLMTKPVRLLLLTTQAGMLLQFAVAIVWGITAIRSGSFSGVAAASALLISVPVVWGHLIVLPLLTRRYT